MFNDLGLDHVEFYVKDADSAAGDFAGRYGFDVFAATADTEAATYSVALGTRDIRMVMTEARTEDHAATAYVQAHGDGPANIALRTGNARAAYAEAVRRGARSAAGPREVDGYVLATIVGFGDVLHTFVERPSDRDSRQLPGFADIDRKSTRDAGLVAMDHFAVCLEAGTLADVVRFYKSVLDFRSIFTERIVVGSQAMNSEVVRSISGEVTLTLIEPDLTCDPGQIDEFVKNHGGAGVQHIAFSSEDIAGSVGTLVAGGVCFLDTPDVYYNLLVERLEVARHPIEKLRDLRVLVDEDHDGQLFQIFTKSTHPRRTLFFEMIERAGARTFGSGNIKALYEAAEAERLNLAGQHV